MSLLKLYGLKRNPFDIAQPPKRGDIGWCFVDLELEDGVPVSQKIDDFVKRICKR